jgi:hypothetical protein
VDGDLGGRTVAENYHAAYPTQRFAMDLAPAADSAVFARALRGEPVRLEEFACFGHPVLAPAAGVVVTAVDTVPTTRRARCRRSSAGATTS